MATTTTTRDVLLRRQGLVFVESRGERAEVAEVDEVELELASLGCLPTTRLRARLAQLGLGDLEEIGIWMARTLAIALGASVQHTPLFRNFPSGTPADTHALWVRKILVHFLQADEQTCLFCRQTGTTHVLRPCEHVVCSHCWDGSNYSACPVCEHKVDLDSPFFLPSPPRDAPVERVTFKLLDLGDDLEAATRALVASFCGRTQTMAPADRDDLVIVLSEHGERALAWLPAVIPIKETVAIVFGHLFQLGRPEIVLPVARRYLATATDILRFIAVLSGADPSLQAQRKVLKLEPPAAVVAVDPRWAGHAARRLIDAAGRSGGRHVPIVIRTPRFKVTRLSRALRRAVLALLDGIPADRLTEDMLRHRSLWIAVGERLHPHEYASRFPTVAAAFAVIRGKAPDGTPAPRFRGFHSKLEAAFQARDADAMIALLRARPGELARRFDHALRLARPDPGAVARLTEAFTAVVAGLTTPVLLTLRSLLPTRLRIAPIRIFWPKGPIARGVSAPDDRALLTADAIAPALRAIDAELLARFAGKPGFDDAIVDVALRDVLVPFNERTASRAAVALPRGSRVALPPGKVLRLFLHWCQPEHGGQATDLDLSVAFYDEAWTYLDVCSYYQLRCGEYATSAGDLRDAPFPDGASELVDIDRLRAWNARARYAVMVVNAYCGMPFDELERSFAGVMLRDDTGGSHFDPRTVELRFDLQGDSGVFVPFVVDLTDDNLHWIDVYSKGLPALNNVATSNQAITKLCPESMAYFASGQRPSIYDLALLHAAARCRRVTLRDPAPVGPGQVAPPPRTFVRRPDEPAAAFLARLVAGTDPVAAPAPTTPVLAALLRGDLDLPDGSCCYALFRGRITAPIAASDLLA